MEELEQKTDSVKAEKMTSSYMSCAEETTENCIEMTEDHCEEQAQEITVRVEEKKDSAEEKPDSKAKKVLIPLLSFLVPVLLFGLAWASNGITYGGNVTPLVYDMNMQYMPFIASLRYLFSGDYSLLFNWNVSLGGNYLALFTYYLASPINLISLLFDLRDMPDAIYVITLIKIGLCGLNLSTFLRFGVSEGKVRWRDILFASCYALMSYNVMYSMCVMWLDGVLMMPLVLLGVEKLLEGKKGLIYFLSIAATFYCNFYISYAVGIFTAIYFLAGAIRRLKKGQMKPLFVAAARFAFLTITAAGLCMPFILPTLKSVSGGYGSFGVAQEPNAEMYSFTVVDLLKKLLPQQYDSIEYAGLPSIFCGSVMVVLFIMFFLQKRGVLHKVSGLLLLTVPVAGFLCPKVDFALHGFQYPHSYMYRYAFVFSFAVLFLAYQASERIRLRGKGTYYLTSALILYTIIELVMNGSVLISGLNEECNYMLRAVKNLQYDLTQPLTQIIRDRGENIRTGFIGTNKGDSGGIMYAIPGTESFTSTFNSTLNRFLIHVGAETSMQVASTKGNTPFANSFLGVKYLISAQRLNSPYRILKASNYDGYELFLYENEYYMPVGFAIPMLNDVEQNFENPFESQNSAARILGYEHGDLFHKVFYQMEKTQACTALSFSFDEGELPYLYLTNLEPTGEDNRSVARVVVNDISEYYVETTGARRFIDLSGLAPETQHIIQIYDVKNVLEENIFFYAMNEKGLYEFARKKHSNALTNITYSGNLITGRHFFSGEDILFTSFPNDGNWQVSVDGEPAATGTALGTFLCVYAPEGEREIVFRYWPTGLTQGLWLAALSALLLLTVLIVESILIKCRNKRILLKKLQ